MTYIWEQYQDAVREKEKYLQTNEELDYYNSRGVYANEKFYVINGNAIEAYRMGDYVKIDDLLL